ncbi:hypothetical protein [Mesorhizobium sp. M0830]
MHIILRIKRLLCAWHIQLVGVLDQLGASFGDRYDGGMRIA